MLHGGVLPFMLERAPGERKHHRMFPLRRRSCVGRGCWFSFMLALSVASGVALYTSVHRANTHASADVVASPPTPPSNVSPPQCFNPAAVIPLVGKTCGIVQDLQLSCSVPADMLVNAQQPDFTFSQRSADVFSWQEFIALNWPARADARGLPDWNKQISEAGPRVGET